MMKMKDMMAAAKAKTKVGKAKAEQRAAKSTARTPVERDVIVERAKAKEAQAKMELHQTKAQNRARRGYFPFFGGNRHSTTGATTSTGTHAPTTYAGSSVGPGTAATATRHNRRSYIPFFGNRRKTATYTTAAAHPSAVY